MTAIGCLSAAHARNAGGKIAGHIGWDDPVVTTAEGQGRLGEARKIGRAVEGQQRLAAGQGDPARCRTLPGRPLGRVGDQGRRQNRQRLGVDISLRVNAICPVIGETAPMETFMGVPDTPDNRKKFEATIPLGRFSKPSDIASAALYLAADESEFLTGVCLEVDGGRTI